MDSPSALGSLFKFDLVCVFAAVAPRVEAAGSVLVPGLGWLHLH